MDTKVLTQDELNSLKNVRETFDNLTTVMGSLETQLALINLEKNDVIDRIKELKQQEIQLGNELKEKYGDGNISLETGEFTPFQTEATSLSPA
jgi:hypothetical protein